MSLAKYLSRLSMTFILTAGKMVLASTFVLPAQGDLVGEIQTVHPENGETLSEIGIRYDMGYYEMLRANPHIHPSATLSEQNQILIPSQFILPKAPREGILINLAEYRLYYFPPNDNVVITMPVGIGRKGWMTPEGTTKVVVKQRNPVWHPSAKLQAEAAKHGTLLPNEFPSGDDNPLGRYALRLNWPGYLIHGSNRREGIGARVSAGCIRMMPEDIEYLFTRVAVGTPVRIINQPIKIGFFEGSLYIQAHPALLEQRNQLLQLTQKQLKKLKSVKINHKVVQNELLRLTGVPRRIS